MAIGFLGASTTFSTFSLETFRLLEGGSHALALANAVGSVAECLAALHVGVVLGRML